MISPTASGALPVLPPQNPQRGEVWRVQLDPVRGSEQGKARPLIVLSEPPNGRSTMRLCAPVVHLKPEHMRMAWCVPLLPDATNGLTKQSTADASQTRALDVVRFENKLGSVSAIKLQAILTALAACVNYTPATKPIAAPTS